MHKPFEFQSSHKTANSLIVLAQRVLAWSNRAPIMHSGKGRSPGPEVIKLFSCSTQLSMKIFLLINVKMPTVVGILTFMSWKNNVKIPTIVGILTFISRKNSIIGLSEPVKS